MKLIKTITDDEFGLTPVEFDNPEVRYAARGIVIDDDGNIALFNKQVKNEFKLPGGGIDEGEDSIMAFKREIMEETGCEVQIINTLGVIEEHKSLGNFKQISYVYVARVINNTHVLNFTQKEKDEGARLLWVKPKDAFKLISDSLNNLKASKYENLYHSKFIVKRDMIILDYYLNN